MVDVSNPSARDGPWDGHAHDWRAHARPRTGSLEGAGMVEPLIPMLGVILAWILGD